MNAANKRKDCLKDDSKPKRVKKECDYGERCYRMNPAHFREYSHRHLEAILDTYSGTGPYTIPDKFCMNEIMMTDQLNLIVEKHLYTPVTSNKDGQQGASTSTETTNKGIPSQNNVVPQVKISPSPQSSQRYSPKPPDNQRVSPKLDNQRNSPNPDSQRNSPKLDSQQNRKLSSQHNSPKPHEYQRNSPKPENQQNLQKPFGAVGTSDAVNKGDAIKENSSGINRSMNKSPVGCIGEARKDSDYRPIVPPTRRAEDFLNVVVPKNNMAAKHAASAPYYIFYTTITSERKTHQQPYSITFQEILDRSLGELKCSLQINFMVEIGWLLAQYYFAGYSQKKLTILYGEECSDLKNISQKKPQVDAHLVQMSTPFGKHHTKMMLLCYEDGSMRVVVSTANLYLDDWENRTQGLWFSPRCPELPATAMPYDGESPTMFKRTLLRYLSHYHLPALAGYMERVKRCDFSHINVFLVASAPGSHFDMDWGMTRVGTLLRQHCALPANENRNWPLLAQASSIGSYGNKASLWLTGDFLHQFTKIKEMPQTLSSPPDIKLIYPSLENVQQSHDGLLGGGCLPYAASAHTKQTWLNDYLFQWRAKSTSRDRAMPHIKSYTRVSPDSKYAAYYLLTSGNVSKAAWGSINKGNAALRIMSYEAGVLFLPRFVINEDMFPLEETSSNRLILPYDVPPSKYTKDMSPWVSDYLSS